MGLDQLENNFPVLHQSTEEVLGSLKDAFFLTLDDVQLRVNDELDGMQGRWDKLTDATWYYLLALQESQLGQMATSGLDDILTRSEEAMAKYMPLTGTLRLEWERRTQQYEDEDGEDEPGLWTRFRGLLLCLSLQLYHRLLKLRNRLEQAMGMLQDATDRMGLSRLLEVVGSVLQMLQLFYVSQVLRLEAMRRLVLDQLKAQVRVLAELGPINQLLGLPAQVQLVVADLQELGKILLQLLVNSTPLYNMLQQPSDQDVEDFLNQQESMSSDTTHRSSASSLFLKAMDGRPHKRKSSYTLSQTGSTSAPSPASAKSPNGSCGSQKQDDQTLSLELKNLDLPSTIAVCCRSSVRRGSSSGINPPDPSPDPSPVPSPAPANPANDDDQSLSRQGSQKPDDQPLSRQGSQKPDDQPLSRRGSQKQEDQPLFVELDSTVCRRSSAIEFLLAPIIQYLSPGQLSDETVIPEVETTKFHPDTRDESLPRHKSLSARSQRSSSSAGIPDDQSLSRRGSQKQDDQPLSLELDPLELPSTSIVCRPSSAAEVLVGSVLQYINSEPSSDEPVVPEVETTENHIKARDESLPRRKSLSSSSHWSLSSAVAPVVETTEDLSPEQGSDEAITLEVGIEYYSDTRDMSPPRRKSLSARSRRSSYRAVAPEVETSEGLRPEEVSDEVIALEVESTEYYSDARDVSPSRHKSLSAGSNRSSSSAGNPGYQSLSRRGSQKQDDQPLSLELDPLELPSTSTVRRPSSAAEVLLGSILQYLSSEPPSDESIIPEVETTENHTETRDESPPRHKSLSAHSRKTSSSAGNSDDQPLSRRGNQKPDDQPLSLELDPLELLSTSTVRRSSSAAEVLLGSILQYISSEPPLEEPVVPEVDNTENTEVRDESPPRCKSLSVQSRRSSSRAGNPSNVRQDSQMRNDQPLSVEFDILDISSTSALRCRSLAAEVLLGPILQYLSSEPTSDETIIPKVETTENQTEARDRSPPRRKSLSARSRWSSYSAVAPEVETTEDQSPEKVSDEAIALEGESTEYYSDARDVSPFRRNSLSAGSHRSSSSAGNPGYQSLSRRGSQKQDDQPLSLELDPLELPSTSTVRRPSSAAEVLLGSILQYLSSEPSSDETVIPEVETTEKNAQLRDESTPRRQSLSPRFRRSSSNAVVPEVETTEYYSDEGDGSPFRCKSLSIRSHRSSSSGGNAPAPRLTPDNTHNGLQGSQMQDNLEELDTSAVRRRSWAVEVLLDPILQYLNPGHSEKADIEEAEIPAVEATEH
ncbi:serine-rich adhesin for platelets-like [Salvelinus alpinus]|uniref:serine-rich adhesin for platelets-like n=1 Tax=Salvelinus alpinus TaxID=8036 RepID=UPI0039FD3E6C